MRYYRVVVSHHKENGVHCSHFTVNADEKPADQRIVTDGQEVKLIAHFTDPIKAEYWRHAVAMHVMRPDDYIDRRRIAPLLQ